MIVLVGTAFLRPAPNERFDLRIGPLALFLAASAIVVSRPDGLQNLVAFILVGALAIRLAQTVDARRIVASLIDGLGLFGLANVVAYLIGLRSSSESLRINLDAEAMARVYFPLAQ
jgi:hypothetical protein